MDASALPLARASAADWLELTKPRITLIVVFTALVGFVTASPGPRLVIAARGGPGGHRARGRRRQHAQQVLERATDALMNRTRNRPIPAGRIRPVEATLFGLLLTAAGLALLACARRRAPGARRVRHLGELPVPLHAAQARARTSRPSSARFPGRCRP